MRLFGHDLGPRVLSSGRTRCSRRSWRIGELNDVNQKAFTITELLVVMPIMTLILGSLMSILFTSWGKMLQDTAEANLRLDSQIMLLNLEDELLFTIEFAEQLKSDLVDEHAPSGGWSFDTDPDTLIVYETALTADRRSADRDFVWKRKTTGPEWQKCSGYLDYAINNLVYFSTANTDDDYRTLYKRTVVPVYDTCNDNYKRMSCPEVYVGTGNCQSSDGVLTEKLVDFQVEYYAEDNILLDTPDESPSDAERIDITLVLGGKSYGKSIEVKTKFSMKKVNG